MRFLSGGESPIYMNGSNSLGIEVWRMSDDAEKRSDLRGTFSEKPYEQNDLKLPADLQYSLEVRVFALRWQFSNCNLITSSSSEHILSLRAFSSFWYFLVSESNLLLSRVLPASRRTSSSFGSSSWYISEPSGFGANVTFDRGIWSTVWTQGRWKVEQENISRTQAEKVSGLKYSIDNSCGRVQLCCGRYSPDSVDM